MAVQGREADLSVVDDNMEVPGPLSSITQASCVPHPGSGVVARWGDILLVVGEGNADAVRMLLEHCEAVATAAGDGRMLSRRLAGLLTASDELMPAFAAAASVETGLAVFVHGSASVAVGDDISVSGEASLSWVDRLIPWPVTTLTLRAGAVTEPLNGPYHLGHGVISGSGLTLAAVTVTPQMPDAAVREPDVRSATGALEVSPPEDEAAASPPLDRWPGQGGAPPAFESVMMHSESVGDEGAAVRPPLPLATEVSRERSNATGHNVRGVYCKNGHFNDPRGLFCAVCGINMVQQTPVLAEGSRPPLGVLLLEDGSAFQLDDDYLLGREPTYDDDVRSGRLRGIVLPDEARSVSRAHARIELRQWDVVLIDNSSANGTYVAPEGENTWTLLTPGTPHVLSSGSRFRLGSCTIAFNAYRGE